MLNQLFFSFTFCLHFTGGFDPILHGTGNVVDL